MFCSAVFCQLWDHKQILPSAPSSPIIIFLNGPAVGHPFSPMGGHLGTTGQDKLATHVRRKLLSGLGGTFLEWLSALETWSWTWAFPFSYPYQWGLSLGTFSASCTHAPGPAIFCIPARWLLKSMDTGGAARSPSRGGLWCSAVKIPAHRSQVSQSIFSLVLTGSYRPCSRQTKLFLSPTQHKLPLPKLAPFWARWPEKASLKDQFKVGHVT